MSLVLVAACGPTVPPADTPDDTTGDHGVAEETVGIDDPSSTGEMPECVTDQDCAQDEVCDLGKCLYDPQCDGGCCYNGGADDCIDYECFRDEDCGPDEACIDYSCEPDPGVHECSGWPLLLGSPTLLLENTGPVALAFVDAHAPSGRDVAVAGDGGVRLASADGTVVDVTVEPATDLTAADLDGDAQDDLLLLEPTGLRTMLADGPGSFASFATVALEQPGEAVVLADFDRNGVKDAWVRTGASLSRFAGAGDGNFGPGELVTDAAGAVVAAPAGSGFDHLLVQNDAALSLALANDAGLFEPTPLAMFDGVPSSLAVGDFELDGFFDAAVIVPSTRILEAGVVTVFDDLAGGGPPATWTLPTGDWNLVATGRFDHDERDELVVAGPGSGMMIRFGGTAAPDASGAVDPLDCYLSIPSAVAVQRMIVGDVDGQGGGDLITSDGTDVWLWPTFDPI
jgi:hypothetical protein